MKFIRNWLNRRKAFKLYLSVLRPYLKEKHGKSIDLKYKDVKEALQILEPEVEFEPYAYAMALSKNQYKKYQVISGVIYSQDALQIELGVSKELLKTQHFPSSNY